MTEEIDAEFLKKMDDIIALTIQNGGLMVVGVNGCGKSNAVQWLFRRIRDNPRHEANEFKTIVFDSVLNWAYNFDKIPYMNYSGILPIVQDLIINLNDVDPIDTRNKISQILMEDFLHKEKLKAQLEGKVPFNNFYIIEEAQNVFGRYTLGQKMGRFMMKVFSEGRNFGMSIIAITQRLADVDTRIVERRQYFLLGATSGDNDLLKIKRMLGSSVADAVSQLRIGEFVFYDRSNKKLEVIGFPLFQQVFKPYLIDIKNKNGFVKVLFSGK